MIALHDKEKVSENLKRALFILNQWLTRNVGSAEHTKAIKMQKIILIEYLAGLRKTGNDTLSSDERMMA